MQDLRVKGDLGWKYKLQIGHHMRYECLEREGEWCRGIGAYQLVDRCKSCPTRTLGADRA